MHTLLSIYRIFINCKCTIIKSLLLLRVSVIFIATQFNFTVWSSPTQISYRGLCSSHISRAYGFGVYYRGVGRKNIGSPIESRHPAQTLRLEQTGGPISGVFAGGLAILLDTLFRSSDADTNARAVVEKPAGRE